jgi:hypothetical protein
MPGFDPVVGTGGVGLGGVGDGGVGDGGVGDGGVGVGVVGVGVVGDGDAGAAAGVPEVFAGVLGFTLPPHPVRRAATRALTSANEAVRMTCSRRGQLLSSNYPARSRFAASAARGCPFLP